MPSTPCSTRHQVGYTTELRFLDLLVILRHHPVSRTCKLSMQHELGCWFKLRTINWTGSATAHNSFGSYSSAGDWNCSSKRYCSKLAGSVQYGEPTGRLTYLRHLVYTAHQPLDQNRVAWNANQLLLGTAQKTKVFWAKWHSTKTSPGGARTRIATSNTHSSYLNCTVWSVQGWSTTESGVEATEALEQRSRAAPCRSMLLSESHVRHSSV